MDALKRWSWPGNIRELQNVIERAVILSPGPELVLPLQDVQPRARRGGSGAKAGGDVQGRRAGHDSSRVEGIGRRHRGPDRRRRAPGLRRTTLQSKMRKLGIQRPSY